MAMLKNLIKSQYGSVKVIPYVSECVETLQCNVSTKVICRLIILSALYWINVSSTDRKNPSPNLSPTGGEALKI